MPSNLLRPNVVQNIGTITAAVHVLLWSRTVYGWARTAITQRPFVRGLAATAADQQNFVLTCNGNVLDCRINSEELLKTYPRGPYTTARTHELKHVFEFDFHNRRISESTDLMVKAGTLPTAADHSKLVDPDIFRERYMSCVRKAIDTYRQKSTTDEIKLTTLLNVKDQESLLYVHVQTLGKRPDGEVKIQIMGAPRDNALAKDSAWVSDREGLWTAREEKVHEVVLCDAEGKLFEGLSSNFFIIARDSANTPTLYTAGEGILLGTVRSLILKMCAHLDVKVVEQAPTLEQVKAADEVLVSSTSRWALPVTEIVMPDKSILRPKSTELGTKIYKLILKHALENSVCVA